MPSHLREEYPLPDYTCNPLKGVTDTDIVKYWVDNDILDVQSEDNQYEEYAETVDILYLVYTSRFEHRFSPQLCQIITFDQIIEFCYLKKSLPLTSLNYKLPDGGIYYSIVERLKNITEDEIDMYIEKYSQIYPPISILLSTLPYTNSYERTQHKRLKTNSIQTVLEQSNMSNTYPPELKFTKHLCKDYLICSTAFNTFNPAICSLFNDSKDIPIDIFFLYAMTYSPPALQNMITNNSKLQKEDWDKLMYLWYYNMHEFHPLCLDIILYSNLWIDLFPLLRHYTKLNNIDKVKLLLFDSDNKINIPTISIMGDNDILHLATSAEMVHLLVSCKANVNSTDNVNTRDPPVLTAIQDRSLEVVKALLYHKASLEGDKDGKHFLHDLGSASHDVVEFLIPFLSSSTSDRSIQVKSNNTTGLPDDVYNHIKSSLSKVDINICDRNGKTPLHHTLSYGKHVPYLLENNASPHIYQYGKTSKSIMFSTYLDVLNAPLSMTPISQFNHYIDCMIEQYSVSFENLYYSIYNLMKYKACPSTYKPLYSHFMLAIYRKMKDLIIILLQYLSPLNIGFKKQYGTSYTSQIMYPLEFALDAKAPRRDTTYELLQYGAIYNPIRKLTKVNDNINTLILDQCFN